MSTSTQIRTVHFRASVKSTAARKQFVLQCSGRQHCTHLRNPERLNSLRASAFEIDT
jgi:hypothetical protein